MKNYLLLIGLIASVAFSGCKKVNLLSLDDDKKLGQQSRDQILVDPATYPILNASQYASSYAFLENIKQGILNSGKVTYKTEFDWELRIIQNDSVLNAFCTPGGYIFVYTGLLKYLDNTSSLAGVLGHEMGHADHRHGAVQITKKYGADFILGLLLGKNNGQLAQIGEELLFLQFSRTDETDADNQSVIYLCPTKYRAAGAADFFQKIINSGASQPVQFLSTHPNPDNRVQNITTKASGASCSNSISSQEENSDYAAFKAGLP